MGVLHVHVTTASYEQTLGTLIDELQQHAPQAKRDDAPLTLPSRDALHDIVRLLFQVLFPLHFGPDGLTRTEQGAYVKSCLSLVMSLLQIQLERELAYHHRCDDESHTLNACRPCANQCLAAFRAYLPELKRLLCEDVTAAYEGDPAATSTDEILLCYPGMLAIIHHRIAHFFYDNRLPLMARMIAELAHGTTGIDIHPGATIGEHFFIDHGTGVVIGETAIIGRNVRLYQAVTLGAKRFVIGDDGHLAKGGARHPIVEEDVVIYAGATLLGRITIGKGAVIGGNVWVTRDVPAHSTITQSGTTAS